VPALTLYRLSSGVPELTPTPSRAGG